MIEASWTDYKNWLGSIIPSEIVCNLSAPQPTNICTDSRKINSPCWFLPLQGDSYDGHNFISQLLADNKLLGAFCANSYYKKLQSNEKKFCLPVDDTLLSLQKIASGWKQKHPKLKTIALTGSVGKSTTKEMVGLILKEIGPCLDYAGNFNNEIGVPLSLLKISSAHKHAVIELGARKCGDIKMLRDIVEADINCCLNVGLSHLGVFSSKENIYKTKTEIFKTSHHQKTKNLVFHDDTKLLALARKKDPQALSFGTHPLADAQLIKSTWHKDLSMSLDLRLFDKKLELRLPCAHASYPINALAAAFASYLLTGDTDSIYNGLGKFTGLRGRYKVIKTQKHTFIDDVYNASPESLNSAFISLQKSFPKHSKTIILGDMNELGETSIDLHKKIAQDCLQIDCLKQVICVGELAKNIFEYLKKIQPSLLLNHFDTTTQLLSSGILENITNKIIYAKASNSLGFERISKIFNSQIRK